GEACKILGLRAVFSIEAMAMSEEAKVRVYKKAISGDFKPYKRIMHYQYIMFTDPLGGRYWFPV
ncbi:MAG: hypothetical protein QXH24_06510, partial [Candidatus Bathyarchaeia archaeon]